MNNIQRVIEERDKEFDDKWKRIESTMTGHISGRKIWSVDTEDEDGGYVFVDESLKSHISETIHQILQAVEEEVGKLDPPPCDCTGAKFECEHWGRHETASDIQFLLKSTKENIK